MLKCSIDNIASKLGIRNYTAIECDACLILKTDDRDFRVQVLDEMDPAAPFEQILRKAFASELQSLGVDCTCISFVFNGQFFIAEEMEKLKEINSDDCSLDEAIKSASIVTRNVEKRLMFPQIVAQLKQRLGIEQVQDLKIASDLKLELSDFALIDNQVIPINTKNQFLAIIDGSNSWGHGFTSDCFVVDTKLGNFMFGPKRICRDATELTLRFWETLDKWWLFPLEFGKDLLRRREEEAQSLGLMHETNVKIMARGETFPVSALPLTIEEELKYI